MEVVTPAVVAARGGVDVTLEAVGDTRVDLLEGARALRGPDGIVVVAEAEGPGSGEVVHQVEALPLDALVVVVVDEVAGVDDQVGPLAGDDAADRLPGAEARVAGMEVGVGELHDPQRPFRGGREADEVAVGGGPLEQQAAEPLAAGGIGPCGGVPGDGGEPGEEAGAGEGERFGEEAAATHDEESCQA